VGAVRLAVRRALPAGDGLVLVACSGGADSLALAAAARFAGRRVGLVTVDHGLQEGSARRALDVAEWARTAGFDPVEVATVTVAGLSGGPEAAARTARYAALDAAASRHQAAVIFLGHTRDDQAETVLLALARGAGPRGLAGMPFRKGLLVRPLLDVSRADTRKACAALGLVPWEDPHNVNPAFARSRVRASALPALIAALGPGVVGNLARSASQIAADNEALDALARTFLSAAATHGGAPAVATRGGSSAAAERGVSSGVAVPGEADLDGVDSLVVADLAALVTAVRTRVLHTWARRLGAPGGALSHRHVAALDALIIDWHGQGSVHLPGGILIARREGALVRVTE
jgi:tRNA(Ile)-lysidine synthase